MRSWLSVTDLKRIAINSGDLFLIFLDEIKSKLCIFKEKINQ